MENKQQIIKDLMKMAGAGFRGPYNFTDHDAKGRDKPIPNAAHLVHPIDVVKLVEWVYRGTATDVHINPKPFTDLLTKDANGVCDAEMTANAASGMEKTWKVSANEIFCRMSCMDEAESHVITITSDYDIEYDYENDAGIFGVEPFDFLRSRAYLVPDSLKQEAKDA